MKLKNVSNVFKSYFEIVYTAAGLKWTANNDAEIDLAFEVLFKHVEAEITLAVREAIASTRAMVDAAIDYAVDPDTIIDALLAEEDEP